jgi:hypothetical protein
VINRDETRQFKKNPQRPLPYEMFGGGLWGFSCVQGSRCERDTADGGSLLDAGPLDLNESLSVIISDNGTRHSRTLRHPSDLLA